METEIGEITNYFDHVGAAALKLNGSLKIGDKIRIKGGDVDFEQKVESMQINRTSVKSGEDGDEIGLIVEQKVRKGYKVYKIH